MAFCYSDSPAAFWFGVETLLHFCQLGFVELMNVEMALREAVSANFLALAFFCRQIVLQNIRLYLLI